MRTQDEIAEKYKSSKSLLGFEGEVLSQYLDFEHVKPFLKPEATVREEEWNEQVLPLNETTVLDAMRKYAEFGWEKIIDHRGISASRTVEKMSAWLWLLGTPQADELIKFAEDEANYPQYGAPILARICETYGFPIPADSGVERMCHGEPCGCSECGCDDEA